MILLDLFLTFLKIGVVSFGGGYGMIPLITEETLNHGWLTLPEILNIIAVSESTPGPIAVNMATFVGASQSGLLGATVATIAVVLPAFLIILLVALLSKKLLKFAGVEAFLSTVRPVVVGLIVGTGILMIVLVTVGVKAVGDTFQFDYKALIILSIVAGVSIFYKFKKKKHISPLILIVGSAFLGIIFYGVLG